MSENGKMSLLKTKDLLAIQAYFFINQDWLRKVSNSTFSRSHHLFGKHINKHLSVKFPKYLQASLYFHRGCHLWPSQLSPYPQPYPPWTSMLHKVFLLYLAFQQSQLFQHSWVYRSGRQWRQTWSGWFEHSFGKYAKLCPRERSILTGQLRYLKMDNFYVYARLRYQKLIEIPPNHSVT
jgi:hypothetical protein